MSESEAAFHPAAPDELEPGGWRVGCERPILPSFRRACARAEVKALAHMYRGVLHFVSVAASGLPVAPH